MYHIVTTLVKSQLDIFLVVAPISLHQTCILGSRPGCCHPHHHSSLHSLVSNLELIIRSVHVCMCARRDSTTTILLLTFGVVLPHEQVRRDLARRAQREAEALARFRRDAARDPLDVEVVVDAVLVALAHAELRRALGQVLGPVRPVQGAEVVRVVVLGAPADVGVAAEVGFVVALDGSALKGRLGG